MHFDINWMLFCITNNWQENGNGCGYCVLPNYVSKQNDFRFWGRWGLLLCGNVKHLKVQINERDMRAELNVKSQKVGEGCIKSENRGSSSEHVESSFRATQLELITITVWLGSFQFCSNRAPSARYTALYPQCLFQLPQRGRGRRPPWPVTRTWLKVTAEWF